MNRSVSEITQIADFQQEQTRQSNCDLIALRYEALLNLVTGKHAQQFLTEMCWDGSAPTRKQLEAKLDKMIEAAR